MNNRVSIALAALSGVLYFLGFVGFDQSYLAWIALAPLLVAMDGVVTGRRVLLISWLMGWVTHLGGYYWTVHLFVDFGQLPLPGAVLSYAALCAFQGGQFAVFGYLAWLLSRRSGLSIGWCAPIALIAAEFIYPLIFPSYTANSQAWNPLLIQIVDLGGVLLLSGVIALVNGAIADAVLAMRNRQSLPRLLPATALGALLATIGYGAWRMPQIDARDRAAAQLKVAVVQANVGESNKHLNIEEGTALYRAMTDEAMSVPGIGLIVWPESGLNQFVNLNENLTGQVASDVKTPMIIGALRAETDAVSGQEKYWNSIVALRPGGDIAGSYDKVKLLAFGETLPGYEWFPGAWDWLLKQNILPFSQVFTPGASYRPLPVGPYRISADVCYEDILPRHMRNLMGAVDERGMRPHAMFNGTNDSWYGPVEPRIHLALSAFRAVEHRRWLVRSTATGISAFIDANGRIVEHSEFEREQTLIHDVPMIDAGPTVYGVIGDAVGWLALLVIVGVLVNARRRR